MVYMFDGLTYQPDCNINIAKGLGPLDREKEMDACLVG
jgi:hypothetical protein